MSGAERLLQVESCDGLVLPGAHFAPATPAGVCIVWIHGFGVSYDFPAYVMIGRLTARADIGFLSCSVRGQHGGVTGWKRKGARLQLARIGGWYEVFEESAWDIRTWVALARRTGYARIILAGHSFGALKVLNYASEAWRDVSGLVLASPGRGLEKAASGPWRGSAEEMVAAGRGEDLLPAGSWPGGFGIDTISAQTYASWARVGQRFFRAETSCLGEIAIPILAWYGGMGDLGGREELQSLVALMPKADVEVCVLDGVRHHCLGGERTVVRTLRKWAEHRGLVGRSSPQGKL